jgi:hypothetical protein
MVTGSAIGELPEHHILAARDTGAFRLQPPIPRHSPRQQSRSPLLRATQQSLEHVFLGHESGIEKNAKPELMLMARRWQRKSFS